MKYVCTGVYIYLILFSESGEHQTAGPATSQYKEPMMIGECFIHMCVLGSFLPPIPQPHPPPSALHFQGRTCSALISNFVEEKTGIIRRSVFASRVKDSYT
jgi:hypothetical protein